MKSGHSKSLLLIWRVAELEAQHLGSKTIEPAHLFLGLCKSVDLDLPALISKKAANRDELLEEFLREIRRIRNIFKVSGLNAKAFRRKLRPALLQRGTRTGDNTRLRRSTCAKQVFSDAEHYAELSNDAVFPVHLLYASVVAKDAIRDSLMASHNIELKRIRQAAKLEIFPEERSLKNRLGDTRSRLN